MSPKLLADALVAADVVQPENHPDSVERRQLVKGWIKAIRWVWKQPKSWVYQTWEPNKDRRPPYPPPKFLDEHRVRMVSFAFYRGKDGAPYLGDIRMALESINIADQQYICDAVASHYETWETKNG